SCAAAEEAGSGVRRDHLSRRDSRPAAMGGLGELVQASRQVLRSEVERPKITTFRRRNYDEDTLFAGDLRINTLRAKQSIRFLIESAATSADPADSNAAHAGICGQSRN